MPDGYTTPSCSRISAFGIIIYPHSTNDEPSLTFAVTGWPNLGERLHWRPYPRPRLWRTYKTTSRNWPTALKTARILNAPFYAPDLGKRICNINSPSSPDAEPCGVIDRWVSEDELAPYGGDQQFTKRILSTICRHHHYWPSPDWVVWMGQGQDQVRISLYRRSRLGRMGRAGAILLILDTNLKAPLSGCQGPPGIGWTVGLGQGNEIKLNRSLDFLNYNFRLPTINLVLIR